jgi:two-component system, cell cycle response regulator DivK
VTSPAPGARDRPLVLIVDDNEKNLKLTRDVLRATGFRTIEAASGGEGILLADEHLPDVVLMDLRLPDMDGVEAARRIGKEPRTAGIPVVALSSVPLRGNGDWLLDGGFAGYLAKPITVREFPDEVRHYCTGAEA